MQKLFSHQLIAFCFLYVFAEFDLSCIAEDSINSDAAWSTHQERPKPDDVKQTNELLVSLEQYLGKIDSDKFKAKELKLISAGRAIVLKDSNGLVHKASEISIGWRKIRLKSPKIFWRHVIGPFASFESAQRISLLLEEDGIENRIAHPLDLSLIHI